MRTLATVSIQWRAAVFSAFKPGGSCRPLSPPRRIYVPDTGFHTAFFVWPSHVTSTWLEAVVCCKVQVARMKERLFSSRMLEHSGLRIVDVMCPGTLCGLDLGICRFCWVEHVNLGT